MSRSTHLGVNIDHVATLRQARGGRHPSPVHAAFVAEQAGANNITMHLREDRRHIQDRDVVMVKESISIPLNLEMAPTSEMIEFSAHVAPHHCCFVPERREELTTEGGLDVAAKENQITEACVTLSTVGTQVGLFVEPYVSQIDAAKRCGAHAIELHTGAYANASTDEARQEQLGLILEAVYHAHNIGLTINAGHGLDYRNVDAVAQIERINTLNIGHSIVSRAVMVGFKEAVEQMKRVISEA